MTVARVEYQNKLEQFYGSSPGPVKTVMNFFGAYRMICNVLHQVTGDPNKVAGKGADYIAASQQIAAVAEAIEKARSGTQQWSGTARAEFDAKITQHIDKIGELAQAVAKTDEILKSAAEACVQGANLIIDVVMMVIKWCIKTYLAALATSWCSFGATVAAWIGANVVRGIQAFQQIMSALGKLGQFLQKLATLLKKLVEILNKVKEILKVLQQILGLVGQGNSSLGKIVNSAVGTIDKVTAYAAKLSDPTGSGSSSTPTAAAQTPSTGQTAPTKSGTAGQVVIDGVKTAYGDYSAGRKAASEAARIASQSRPPSF